MFLHVNGIDLYYEKSGQGPPFILLHGNGEDHSIFDMLIPRLAENYTVYAIDSRDHGRSSPDRQLSYAAMAADTAAFICELELIKPILYGFSDGGIIGLLIAITYPKLLSGLVVSGANLHPNGIRTGYSLLTKAVYFFSKNHRYKLMLTEPDIPAEALRGIAVPTLVLAGEHDLIKPAHTRLIAANIPNSVLKILPGEDHASYVVHSQKLFEIIQPFLT